MKSHSISCQKLFQYIKAAERIVPLIFFIKITAGSLLVVKIAIGPKFMENKELGVKERICFIRDLNGIAIEFIQRGF